MVLVCPPTNPQESLTPGQGEDALGHVADRERDAARRGLERDFDLAGLASDLERQGVRRAASAFPGAAAALDLDHVELGVVDGLP